MLASSRGFANCDVSLACTDPRLKRRRLLYRAKYSEPGLTGGVPSNNSGLKAILVWHLGKIRQIRPVFATQLYYWSRPEDRRRFVGRRHALSRIPREELSRRLHRQFRRFKFQVNAEVVWQARQSWGRVTNVSRNGLFVEMAEPPSLGSRFTTRLALNVPLELDCLVRRVVPGRGIGVALSVPARSKRRFEALLLALSASSDPAATAAAAPRREPPQPLEKAAAAKA